MRFLILKKGIIGVIIMIEEKIMCANCKEEIFTNSVKLFENGNEIASGISKDYLTPSYF